MLERLAKDKHSSLLQKSVNYGRNKFYDIDPSQNLLKAYNFDSFDLFHQSVDVIKLFLQVDRAG
jgi:hypothetical protein